MDLGDSTSTRSSCLGWLPLSSAIMEPKSKGRTLGACLSYTEKGVKKSWQAKPRKSISLVITFTDILTQGQVQNLHNCFLLVLWEEKRDSEYLLNNNCKVKSEVRNTKKKIYLQVSKTVYIYKIINFWNNPRPKLQGRRKWVII